MAEKLTAMMITIIQSQLPQPVKLEQGFPGMYPVAKIDFNQNISESSFEFEGTGFSLRVKQKRKIRVREDYIFRMEFIWMVKSWRLLSFQQILPQETGIICEVST